MYKRIAMFTIVLGLCHGPWVMAQTAPASAAPAAPAYDAALAQSLGADERGMRTYTLVILKTGPNRIPAGPERTAMFQGHFANINKLAGEGKLAVAGPFDGVDGWRGAYVLATADLEEAKKYIEADPVVIKGEMVAEYHKWYATAGLMAVNGIHQKIQKPK